MDKKSDNGAIEDELFYQKKNNQKYLLNKEDTRNTGTGFSQEKNIF